MTPHDYVRPLNRFIKPAHVSSRHHTPAHPSTPAVDTDPAVAHLRIGTVMAYVAERRIRWSGAYSRDGVLRLLSPDESSEIINCVRWYLSYGEGTCTSHIDYIRQTSRRLNTTRQIHQDTTRLSKHTCTPVESRPIPSLICGSARS